nr:hypothetical protein [Tanacetum cinerariifolium]
MTLNLSLMWLLIKCTNRREPLLQSSTSVYLGKSLIDNRDHTKQEKMYSLHSKDKSISMRNKIFMHTLRDDNVLGTLRLVSKSDEYQELQLLRKLRNSRNMLLILRRKHLLLLKSLHRNLLLEESPLWLKSETLLGDSDDDNDDDDQQSEDEKTKSDDDDKVVAINKSDAEEEDEFVHTPDDYVPTDDEDVNDEEFDHINKEMYSDLNVELKDSEREGEGKDDEEMTDPGHEDAEHEKMSQMCSNYNKNLRKVLLIFARSRWNKQGNNKSLNIQLHKALYHAPVESILEDEDAMDKGVADKLKKRKPDDDRDEGRPTGPDQGLKRKKTCNETEPSKKAKSTETSKGTTKSRPKLIGKSTQAEEIVFKAGDTQDWFKKSERPPTQDPKWNKGKSVENKPTQKWLSDLAKVEKPSKIFDDLMSTLIDFGAFVMKLLQISDLPQDILAAKYDLKEIKDMVPNLWSHIKVAYDKHALLGHLEDIEVQRSDQKLYTFKEGDFPRLHLNDIEDMLLLVVQNRLFNLEGDIIVHFVAALRVKRLMPSGELYKFSDGTLQSVWDTLHDMATNLRMRYNKPMPKRIWTHINKTRSHIMVKEFDRWLQERRLMRSLKKFVGGRHYGEDLRLLQRTI